VKTLLLAATLCLAALPIGAQSIHDVPPRPVLFAQADTNSAQAYYLHGVQILEQEPRTAAAAFYWANRIQPDWAEALYARRVALLMIEPRRLVRYMNYDRATHRSAEIVAIDSLMLRALMQEPFLEESLDRRLFRTYLYSLLELRTGSTVDAHYLVNAWMGRAAPYLRGRFAYSEGRFGEAVTEYDRALRSAERDAKPRIRIQLARAQYFMDQFDGSLANLDTALTESRARDSRDLVAVYESKALLEHSAGAVHEKRGNLEAARAAYGRALQEDLSYSAAHRRLSEIALQEGDLATALAEMALVVEIDPGSPSARHRYALMLLRNNQLDEGAAELRRAIELEPIFAAPHFLLGAVNLHQQAWEDAERNLQSFLRLSTRDDPARAQAEAGLAQARAAKSPATGTP
jgi:tetratricopeptide (TPR) repeat protein